MTGPTPGIPLAQQPAGAIERMNVYAEAQGEGVVGMAGVWHVVNTRSSRRDTTRAEEVLRDKQFSWVANSAAARRAVSASRDDPVVWALVDAVCTLGEAGLLRDPTGGADHYYNAALATPPWGRGSDGWHETWVHGRHVFGRCA